MASTTRHDRRRLLTVLGAGLAAGVGLLAALSPVPAARADADSGALLAAACTSCHGVNGRSTTLIASLAGRPAAELGAALLAFRDGSVGSTIMGRIAKGYTPEQIALLAAWFAEQ